MRSTIPGLAFQSNIVIQRNDHGSDSCPEIINIILKITKKRQDFPSNNNDDCGDCGAKI
uniref:Uncharacterized protein n=1 Tax=Tetranychus urticae TaxID=32264 RepID=T1JWI2_TETUR